MPRPKAPSICPQPGCPNDQPCPDHGRKAWQGSDRRSRLPADWNRRRQRILRRDGHQCRADHHAPTCDGTGTEVDHIEHGDDHSDANLRAIHPDCHRLKTLREAAEARGARNPPGYPS